MPEQLDERTQSPERSGSVDDEGHDGVDGPAHRWAPPALVLAVCLLPLVGLWRTPGPPMEEGFMLVFPELVLEGRLPNRDFLHLYGPGGLWVLAGAYQLFGTSLAVERVVGLAQHLGVAFGVYALIRPWGRWVAAGGGVTAAVTILTPHGLTALAWVGAVALGLWAVRSGCEAVDAEPGSTRRRRQVTIGGLLAGAALLYRLDLVLAVGLAAAVIATGLDRATRRRGLIALAVGLSPYLIHLLTAGPANVVDGMLIEPVFGLRGGRGLPLPPATGDFYDGFLQQVGTIDEPPWPLPALRGPLQLALWLGLLLVVVGVLAWAGLRAFRRGERRLLAIAGFGAGLLPQALQRADSTHVAWVACVAFGVLPAAIMELTRGHHQRVRVLAAVGLPLLVTLAVIPYFTWRPYADAVAATFGGRPEVGTMRNGDRTFLYGRPEAVDAVNDLLPVVDDITDPGDRLFVGPGDLRKTPYNEAFLYHLLPELVPATRYIEMDPGVANAADSGLADEVASADVLILSTIRDAWTEPNGSRDFGPDEPNQVVARDFCLVGAYGDGDGDRGLYEVYRRC
ncbi:MAG: hypothetical protein ACRD0A_20735 [Acidimicrobiales bacterium]